MSGKSSLTNNWAYIVSVLLVIVLMIGAVIVYYQHCYCSDFKWKNTSINLEKFNIKLLNAKMEYSKGVYQGLKNDIRYGRLMAVDQSMNQLIELIHENNFLLQPQVERLRDKYEDFFDELTVKRAHSHFVGA